MNNKPEDNKTIKEIFDADDTQSFHSPNSEDLNIKFAEMRKIALDQIPDKSQKKSAITWVIPSLATCAVAFVAVIMFTPKANILDSTESLENTVGSEFQLSEMDILVESEDVDMLADEDPEFYLWLEQAS